MNKKSLLVFSLSVNVILAAAFCWQQYSHAQLKISAKLTSEERTRIKRVLSESPGQWCLLLPDSTVYGPVELPVLQEWTTQCRLIAGNALTQDGKTWVWAEDVPELNLDWIVKESKFGHYGPINISALPMLVSNAKVSESATLENIRTKVIISVEDKLKEMKVEQTVP